MREDGSGMPITDEQRRYGRLAGAMILLNFLLQGLGDSVTILARGGKPFADTARVAAGSPVLWRVSLLEVGAAWIAIGIFAFGLYAVLAPIDRRFAQLALVLRLGASFVGASSLMFRVAQLRIYKSFLTEEVFTPEQLRTLAAVVQTGSNAGVWTAWILQGAGSLLFYLLFRRSHLLPRWIALLGIVASALLVATSATMFVFPEGTNAMKLLGLPLVVADVAMAVLLLGGPEAREASPPPSGVPA